jgi:hypothetical protein
LIKRRVVADEGAMTVGKFEGEISAKEWPFAVR